MRSLIGIVAVCVLAFGCREELGDPDYSTHLELELDGGPEIERLAGTDPWIPGTDRLNIGLFYEGASTRQYRLDAERLCLREPHVEPLRCYFIFETPEGDLQYDQDTVDDRIEGVLSDRLVLTGTAFWGGGVVWDEPTDLSAWSMLAVALKSSDPSFEQITITMLSGVGDDISGFPVDAADYGWAADGEWHALRIPVADFEGLDRINVRSPFVIGGMGNGRGDELLVDEVYMTRE